MLILGGEPPFVENPEPRFGEVIKKMNEMSFFIEERTRNFNENIKEKLEELQTGLDEFIAGSIVPIEAHLAERGAVHGETKSTIGLSKKDNYRTATLEEQKNFSPVNAFVTPQGAKIAMENNKSSFDVTDFQANNVFQLASYYYPDEYPVVPATVIEPARYLETGSYVPVLLNGDRLIYSPASNKARYSKQLIFASLPYRAGTSTRVSEITNLGERYTGANWNPVGALTDLGNVGFFRPLADKQIYNYKTNLALPAGNQNFILYQSSADVSFKGFATSASVAGQTISLGHRFFYVDKPEVDPTLVNLVTDAYVVLFDRIGLAPYVAPINGSHSYNFGDFLTLPAGATLELDARGLGPVTALFWNSTDYELYFNVSVPLIARLNGKSQELVLSFTESFIPGTLRAGGSGNSVRMLGPRVKDVLGADLMPVGTSSFVKVADIFDINNPAQTPGVLLNSGLMLKAKSTKYGMRIKRYDTKLKGIKAWLLGDRPVVPVTEAITEMFTPSRHSPFGLLPERIVPFNNDANITQFFAYGLNGASGKFEWKNLTWNSGSIVSTQTPDNVFGVRLPDIAEDNKEIGLLPGSLIVRVNKNAPGVALSPMVFSTDNNFKSYDSMTYVNKVLTLGNPVEMDFSSTLPLQATTSNVKSRAAIANPTVDDSLRKMNIQVFAVNTSKVLIMISDGLSYAEVGVANYTVVNHVINLDYTATNGLQLTPVTPSNTNPTGASRDSRSNDGVWMNSSDLLISQTSPDIQSFVVTRPFGLLYGDLSFNITGFTSTVNPVITGQKLNPARLYPGTEQIDLAEELFPALAIPNKGVFQSVSPIGATDTTMNEVGGTLVMDPFNINEAGWARMPAGARVVLGGKTYILDREFAVKVNMVGVTWCYLMRLGEVLVAVGSTLRREVANNEVLFGVANNGILQVSKSYLVMNNHVITSERRGSAIPVFDDDGLLGVNKFFTKRDVL